MARCVATDEVYDFGGIFIDIGGGTTDVALVRNGGIEGTRMFPIGGRGFTKKLAAHLRVSFFAAQAGKPRHPRGELPPAPADRGPGALSPGAEGLGGGVGATLP